MIPIKCLSCKNYIDNNICSAFAYGIPEEILTGENDHSEPLPDQDNDIVFEEVSEEKNILTGVTISYGNTRNLQG
jgi:hypothetical protein